MPSTRLGHVGTCFIINFYCCARLQPVIVAGRAEGFPGCPDQPGATCCAFVATPSKLAGSEKARRNSKGPFCWMNAALHSLRAFHSASVAWGAAGGCVRKDYTNASVVLHNTLMHSLLAREDLMMCSPHVPIKFKCPTVGTNSQKGFSPALWKTTQESFLSLYAWVLLIFQEPLIFYGRIIPMSQSQALEPLQVFAVYSHCPPGSGHLSAALTHLLSWSSARCAGARTSRSLITDRPDFALFRQPTETDPLNANRFMRLTPWLSSFWVASHTSA